MNIIFNIVALAILLLFVIIVGILLFKKIPDKNSKQIIAKITYTITVLGIIVAIIIPLINSISDYIDNKEKDNSAAVSDISTEPTVNNQLSTLEEEENNDFTNATLITCNKEISGSFDNNNDIDCFYFTTDVKISFKLKFTHDFNDSDNRLCSISIYSESDLNNPIFETESGEKNTELISNQIRVPAGTYYIKLTPPSYGELTIKRYKFIVKSSNEDSTFESEPNNTINDSKTNNLIPLNSTITGNIQTQNDIDYYYFSVKNPGKINISFSHNKIDSDTVFWKIELLAENEENAIISFNSNGAETSRQSDTINISPEKESDAFYLKVSPNYTYSSDDYKICVNFSEFETNTEHNNNSYNYDKEPNNGTEIATPILLNKNIEGNIQSPSDIDYFKFSVDKDGELNILFEHDFSDSDKACWKVSLLSENSTNNLIEFRIASNEASKNSDNIRIPPGTYYLKIEPTYNYRNDSYKFKINYDEV